MVRFACPSCKTVLVAQDHQANTKILCSVCSQRLLVPQPVPVRPPDNPNVTLAGVTLAPRPPSKSSEPFALHRPARPEPTPRSAKQLPGKSHARGVQSASWLPIGLLLGASAVFAFTACGAAGFGVWWFFGKQPSPAKVAADGKGGDAGPDKKNAGGKPSGQQIYERLLKSTVWINNPQGSTRGTGVLINEQEKLVVTNYHVVARTNVIQVVGGEILDVIEDQLTQTDRLDPDNKRYKSYDFQLSRNNVYQIDMISKQFDSYLKIIDDTGRIIAEDDDSGGFPNARIRLTPQKDGKYEIIATTYDRKIGSFLLVVSQVNPINGAQQPNKKVASFVTVNFPEFAGGRAISDKAHYLKCINANREAFKAKVVAVNESKDLAIIQLNQLPPGIRAVPLAKDATKPGQQVHSIGNPSGSGAMWVYTSGTVRTAPYRKQWQSLSASGLMMLDASVIETQSPTNPGDSGGPLVNEAGELVAVTQGITVGANAINLFIDVNEVHGVLKANNLRGVEK